MLPNPSISFRPPVYSELMGTKFWISSSHPLPALLLRLFIQRIEIGARSEKGSRNASQSIRIIYRDSGAMDSPMLPGAVEPRILPPFTMDSIQKASA